MGGHCAPRLRARAIEFGARVPLGVNMAFRRERLRSRGRLRPADRQAAGTLLGQEVREWCIRARKAGVRGFYIPEHGAAAHHPGEPAEQGLLPALVLLARHQPRAALRAIRPRHGSARQTRLDFSTVPHVLGVPRYLYRKAFRAADWLRDTVRGDPVEAFDHELWLCFFAGIVRQRFRDSRARRTAVAHVAPGA